MYKKFIAPCKGLMYAFRRELSFQIELGVAILVIVLARFFNFSNTEWILLFLIIGLVLSAELFNTVLEKILDLHEPRLSHHVGVLKDMLAAAVLVTAVVALIAGVILFSGIF